MGDENAGSAWYELGARNTRLREDLRAAEADIRRAGDAGERLFATPMERATGRVARGVQEVGRALNSLSGRTPRELADQLDRAEREADQALAAIRQLARSDNLSPTNALKYADALNEIQVEADQTVADLRELQRSDPRFDTAELRQAATLIDRVGDEARSTATELDRMGKGDTHLAGVSRRAREAASEFDRADKSAGRFNRSIGAIKASIIGLGVAFGLREAIAKMNEAVNAASGLEEATSKVNVVFGEGSADVKAWAEDAATAFGQSNRSALETAGTYGNLLQAFGIARPAAVEMSKTLVELASDLASFNNTSVEEAITALRSGLTGETEAIKRYGVALNDVRIKEEAMRLGLVRTATGTLPIAIKAQAAYSLILRDTALAQGDFARTSGGFANQQRILAAQMEDLSAEIGRELLPLWKDLIGFMRDPGIPIIRAVAQEIRSIAKGAGIAVDAIGDAFRTLQIYMGDLGKGIEDRANEIGVSVDDMKRHVLHAMNDMNMGLDEATTYAEQRLAGIPYAMTDAGMNALAAFKQSEAQYAETADEIGGLLPEALQEGQDEAVEIARQTPGALAAGLREDIGDYQKALDEIVAMTVNSVSDTKERGEIEAILASKAIGRGLTSDSTRTRLETLDLVNDLLADYELLAPGALAAGELVNPAMAEGMDSNLGLATDAAERIVDAAGNPLVEISDHAYGWGQRLSQRFLAGMGSYWQAIRNTSIALGDAAAVGIRLRSPAKEGALAEDAAVWSNRLVDRWLGPLWAAVPAAEAVSKALGGAIAAHLQAGPAGAGPSLEASPSARNDGEGSGRTQIFHLYFEGQHRVIDSPFAAVEEAQRMGAIEGV